MAIRTPRELIEIYWERIYNSGEVELVREVCANPIIRHDPECVTPLSHDEQIVRIQRSQGMKPLFTHRVLHADDRFVTSVWNMVSRDGRNIRLCGIEVFEACDGRFTRCWNSAYEKGRWGEDGDEFDSAALSPPALVSTGEGISADWLQRAFSAGGVVAPQRLAMEPEVTPIGHGTTSETVKIRATYNSGTITAPRTAICKIGRPSAGSLSTTSPFERERRAYDLFGSDPGFRAPISTSPTKRVCATCCSKICRRQVAPETRLSGVRPTMHEPYCANSPTSTVHGGKSRTWCKKIG